MTPLMRLDLDLVLLNMKIYAYLITRWSLISHVPIKSTCKNISNQLARIKCDIHYLKKNNNYPIHLQRLVVNALMPQNWYDMMWYEYNIQYDLYTVVKSVCESFFSFFFFLSNLIRKFLERGMFRITEKYSRILGPLFGKKILPEENRNILRRKS